MSEPFVYRAPIPYSLCDALMAQAFNMHIGAIRSIKRKAITSASCIYTIGGPPLGSIYLRETSDNQTLITLYPDNPSVAAGQIDNLRWYLTFLQRAIDHLEQEIKAPLIETLEPINDTASQFAGFYTRTVDTPQKPASRKRRGPRMLPANKWAREQAALGKTIDELLPEYMRRRTDTKDPTDARELLRKTIEQQKRKK